MKKNRVILYDGVCNLCNSFVQFVLKHDENSKFKFAALQSEYGQEVLKKAKMNTKDFSSFILEENGQVYSKSSGALKVLKELKGYKWISIFYIIPKPIRDTFYKIISNNRYKWFGKSDQEKSCLMPTKELNSRFVH